jgi:IS1 family transposase
MIRCKRRARGGKGGRRHDRSPVGLCQTKQKRCSAHERQEAGDRWTHTAVAADSKLVVSCVVGKWTHEQTQVLGHDTKRRLRPGHLPVIFTDAYEGYESAI